MPGFPCRGDRRLPPRRTAANGRGAAKPALPEAPKRMQGVDRPMRVPAESRRGIDGHARDHPGRGVVAAVAHAGVDRLVHPDRKQGGGRSTARIWTSFNAFIRAL